MALGNLTTYACLVGASLAGKKHAAGCFSNTPGATWFRHLMGRVLTSVRGNGKVPTGAALARITKSPRALPARRALSLDSGGQAFPLRVPGDLGPSSPPPRRHLSYFPNLVSLRTRHASFSPGAGRNFRSFIPETASSSHFCRPSFVRRPIVQPQLPYPLPHDVAWQHLLNCLFIPDSWPPCDCLAHIRFPSLDHYSAFLDDIHPAVLSVSERQATPGTALAHARCST